MSAVQLVRIGLGAQTVRAYFISQIRSRHSHSLGMTEDAHDLRICIRNVTSLQVRTLIPSPAKVYFS